jgi:hypothetical protein
MKDLEFGFNQRNLIKITSILLNQLKYDHPVSTLKLICENIIYVQPSKLLSEESANDFVYFYSEFI